MLRGQRGSDKAAEARPGLEPGLLTGDLFKGLPVPCPWTRQMPGGHHRTDAACLHMGAQGSWRRKGPDAPRRRKTPSRQAGQKGCEPQGPCHVATGRPSAEEREGPQRGAPYGSGIRPRYLVGPGVVHREGQGAGERGAASVEERAVG